MASTMINIGLAPNDGTGVPLRDAFDIVNNNFTAIDTHLISAVATIGSGILNSTSPISGSLIVSGGVGITQDVFIGGKLNVGVVSLSGVTGATGQVLTSNGTSAAYWSNVAVSSVAGRSGDVILTKSDVGLSAVDNISDINKPVSTQQQAALNLKVNIDNPVFTGILSGVTAVIFGLSNIASIGAATLVTSTTTADQVIGTAEAATVNVAKYLLKITSGSSFQTTEILVMHDGVSVFMTEYATLFNNAVLASFNADLSGGQLRLLATPVNAVTTFTVLRNVL